MVPLEDLPVEARKSLPFDHPTLDEHAARVEAENDLPPGILRAIKNYGERSQPGAVSQKGARGVMQFMPETAQRYGLADPHDPLAAIEAAGKYVKDISNTLNTDKPGLLAAAYNSGENRKSLREGRVPNIPETQAYAVRVNNAVRSYAPKAGEAVPASDMPSEAVPAADAPSVDAKLPQPKAGALKNIGMGALKGASDIGATILRPVDALLNATGLTDTTNAERRQKLAAFFGENADPDSLSFKGGELGAGIAGTAGAGGVLGKVALKAALPKLAAALESGGFRLAGAPATTGGQMIANAGTRVAGGAITGGTQAAMINPNDAGTGAALGGAFPVVGKVAGELGRGAKAALYDPLVNQKNLIAEAVLRAVGSQDAPQVIAALSARRASAPGVQFSAGEASGSAPLNAIEDTFRATNPGGALNRGAQTNRTALANTMRSIAQDDAAMTAAEAARAAGTAPLRDAALTNANYGTTKTTDLSTRLGQKVQQISDALRDRVTLQTRAGQNTSTAKGMASPGLDIADYERFPILGRDTPEIPALAAKAAMQEKGVADIGTVVAQRQAERDMLGRQLDSLQQAGYSPLNAGTITKSIDGMLSKPGIRASDVAQKTLGSVKEKLASLADKNGNIDARDLYTVRKEIGNTISVHAKESGNWDKRLASGLERNLQGSIDSAIEKAGAGDLWKQYLGKYQELSKPMDQMKIGKALAEKLIPSTAGDAPARLNAASLATAMRNPDAVAKNATGFSRARMADTMTPDQLRNINSVTMDAGRIADMHALGAGYSSPTARRLAISNFIGQNFENKAPMLSKLAAAMGNVPAVGLLSKGISTVGSMAAKGINAKMAESMENMLATDPQGVADAIRTILRQQSGTSGLNNPQLQNVLRTLPITAATQANP